MPTPLERKYQRIRAEAEEVAGAKHPGAELIISFSYHDCIVDVLIAGEKSLRYVYIPEDK